jgi:hypothetical protein
MDVKEILLLAAIAASVGLYLTMVGGFVAPGAIADTDIEPARFHLEAFGGHRR